MNIEIIGLIGVIGSGKDYLSDTYVNYGFKKLSFAECSKDLLWEVLEWKPVSHEQENEFKDSYKLYIDNNKNESHSISGRNLIINFSEKIKQYTNEKIWSDMLIMKMKKGIINGYNKFVISDVRFKYEIEGIKNYYNYRRIEYRDNISLKFIFCNYKSERYCITNDKSEMLAQDLIKKGYEHLDIISF